MAQPEFVLHLQQLMLIGRCFLFVFLVVEEVGGQVSRLVARVVMVQEVRKMSVR